MRQPRPEISVTGTDRDSYRSCPGKVSPGPVFFFSGKIARGPGLGVERGALSQSTGANRVTLV